MLTEEKLLSRNHWEGLTRAPSTLLSRRGFGPEVPWLPAQSSLHARHLRLVPARVLPCSPLHWLVLDTCSLWLWE